MRVLSLGWSCVCGFLLVSSVASSAPVPNNLSMRKPAPPAAKRRWIVAQASPTPPAEPAPTTPAEPPPAAAEPATPPVETPPPAITEPRAAPAPVAAPAPEAATPAEPESEEDQSAGALTGSGEEIFIVTGSLIERKELTTPSPVTVVSHADLTQSGRTSIGDVLQNLPAQSNAINTQFNNGGDGSTRIDLRGLGAGRTLVLVNGRRVVPGGTGADSAVDLNAIPLAMIDHVEVLKDGASAIYGSDAIGGVVNIITRSDFAGQEASAYSGSSQRGDGLVYDLSFATGGATKRSNFVFSAGYSETKAIFSGDRGWSSVNHDIVDWDTLQLKQAGSTAVPGGFLQTDEDGDGKADPGNSKWNDDVVAGCPSGTCTLDPKTGKWRDFDGMGYVNDTYVAEPENYLVTPSKRYNVFSTGSYDFSESVRGFFEAMYLNRSSEQMLAPVPLFVANAKLTISKDSIYNPFGKDISNYRRRFSEMDNRFGDQNIGTFRLVGGVDGQLPERLPIFNGGSWELSYNFGRTDATQTHRGDLIKTHLASALGPSYRDEKGVARCGTPTAPGPEGCVPLDILGGALPGRKGSITPEMAKYLAYTAVSTGYNQQSSVLGTMRGPLARTPWGGFVAMGMGASYREEAGGFTPDPLAASGDGTGNAADPTEGGFNVLEQFAELSIVPVVEKDWLKWTELSLAARAVEYSSFGAAATWKAGALIRVSGGFGLRGTYSTAFRAPAINELYSGSGDSASNLHDPCDHTAGPLDAIVEAQCLAQGVSPNFEDPSTQITTTVGGNPDLEPETAKVFTGGVVWEAPMVKGLALTLDYFNFHIDNAITTIGGDVILSNCYSDPRHTSCDKIHRRMDGAIDYIDDKITNIGGNATSGVDFAVGYEKATADAGRFRGQVEGTYLFKYQLTNAEGKVREGRGRYDLGLFPDVKAKLVLQWALGNWGVGTNVRYLSSFNECEDNNCQLHEQMGDGHIRKVHPYVTGDLFASYNLDSTAGRTVIAGGINNVIDADPATIYNHGPDGDPSGYDFIGRFFYLRLTQAF